MSLYPPALERILRALAQGRGHGLKMEAGVIHIHPLALEELIIQTKPYRPVDTILATICGIPFREDDTLADNEIVIRWEVKV